MNSLFRRTLEENDLMRAADDELEDLLAENSSSFESEPASYSVESRYTSTTKKNSNNTISNSTSNRNGDQDFLSNCNGDLKSAPPPILDLSAGTPEEEDDIDIDDDDDETLLVSVTTSSPTSNNNNNSINSTDNNNLISSSGSTKAYIHSKNKSVRFMLPADDENENSHFETKTGRIKDQIVSQVTNGMRDNISRLLDREANLYDLHDASDELNFASDTFRDSTARIRRKLWWRKQRKRLVILAIIAIVSISVLIPLLIKLLTS